MNDDALDRIEDEIDLLDFRTGKGKPGPLDPLVRDSVKRLRAALAATGSGAERGDRAVPVPDEEGREDLPLVVREMADREGWSSDDRRRARLLLPAPAVPGEDTRPGMPHPNGGTWPGPAPAAPGSDTPSPICCTAPSCCGPGSTCCANAGPHTHEETP